MKTKIELLFSLQSPLHISSPERDAYASPDSGVVYGEAANRFALTRTYRMPLAQSGLGELDGRKAGPSVPILPANGLRGRLRRQAANVFFELLAKRGEKLSLEAYHVATCGAPSGVPDGTQMKLSETVACMAHPYIGLFGGGRRFTRGSLSVGTGYPVHELTLSAGIVPEDYREMAVVGTGQNYDTNRLTTNIFFTRKDDLITFAMSGARAHIDNADEAIAEWLSTLDTNRKRKETEKAEGGEASKKQSLAGVSATEVVLPGVPMHATLIVDTAHIGDAGLGLLIHAITGLANCGQHGGKGSVGLGKFTMQATAGGQSLVVRDENGRYDANFDNPAVAAAVDAWASYSESVTAENFSTALLQ